MAVRVTRWATPLPEPVPQPMLLALHLSATGSTWEAPALNSSSSVLALGLLAPSLLRRVAQRLRAPRGARRPRASLTVCGARGGSDGAVQRVSGVERWLPDLSKFSSEMLRTYVGVGICMGSFLAPWHILPVFLDIKIAADPTLPGLTEQTLPLTMTAMFLGWLVGSVALHRVMEIFNKEQILVGGVSGLLAVALATVIVPDLTGGDVVLFTLLRFIYGILMNIVAVQCVHVQETMPEGRGNQALVGTSVIYSVIAIFLAGACSLDTDWRIEALVWYAVPLICGLLIAFPNWPQILQSIPISATKTVEPAVQHEVKAVDVEPEDQRHTIALAISFLACGCGFYGLSYSAGQLSPNPYESTILLSAADILGYFIALSADVFGRNKVQGSCFALAAACLMVCSLGEPGSPLVLGSAMLGRLCLDVCFTTIYVAVAAIFSESAQKFALPACEIAARLGGVLAPFSGTLPAAVSCPIFAAGCAAAACTTMTLPELGRHKRLSATTSA